MKLGPILTFGFGIMLTLGTLSFSRNERLKRDRDQIDSHMAKGAIQWNGSKPG